MFFYFYLIFLFLQKEVGAKSRQTSSNILGSTLIFTYVSLGIWASLFIISLLYDFLYYRPKIRRQRGESHQWRK